MYYVFDLRETSGVSYLFNLFHPLNLQYSSRPRFFPCHSIGALYVSVEYHLLKASVISQYFQFYAICLTELLLYIYSNILNIQNSINKVKSGKAILSGQLVYNRLVIISDRLLVLA